LSKNFWLSRAKIIAPRAAYTTNRAQRERCSRAKTNRAVHPLSPEALAPITLNTMTTHMHTFIHDLASFSEENHQERTLALDRARLFICTSADEFDTLWNGLCDVEVSRLRGAAELLQVWMTHWQQARKKNRREGKIFSYDDANLDSVARLYAHLPREFALRERLLEGLAWGASAPELELFVKLLLQDPPHDERALGLVLSPLFRQEAYPVEALFPRLLAALENPQLAASVLDLANYLTSAQRVPEHPAADRRAMMAHLLGELAQRLQQLEEHPERLGASPQQLSQVVAHGVSLAVALCHALALLNATEAIPKFMQILELRHRRLRTEAAGALAKLGEKTGAEELLKLAAEPVARLRVLAYAEELGMLNKVAPQWTTPAAKAEAELVLWLAEPSQYGVPPAECELIDQRSQFWPSYEEPVECFLFRFQYRFATGDTLAEYANVGIVGPLVRSISADLTTLPVDDVYAIFAGWHVEHEDIFEVESHLLSESQGIEAARLERRLKDHGCEEIRPLMLAYFFNEKGLVAKVRHQGKVAIAMATHDDFLCYPEQSRSLGPNEVLYLYRGRKLLSEFNAEI
jgi:hypothetical protein